MVMVEGVPQILICAIESIEPMALRCADQFTIRLARQLREEFRSVFWNQHIHYLKISCVSGGRFKQRNQCSKPRRGMFVVVGQPPETRAERSSSNTFRLRTFSHTQS